MSERCYKVGFFETLFCRTAELLHELPVRSPVCVNKDKNKPKPDTTEPEVLVPLKSVALLGVEPSHLCAGVDAKPQRLAPPTLAFGDVDETVL